MPNDPEPPDFSAYNPPESALLDKWNLVNKAANKDMRWWFFVLLMIGMVTVGFLYVDMRGERASMRLEITQVRKDQLEYVTAKSEAMMEALVNNTRALEANTQTLNRIDMRKNP